MNKEKIVNWNEVPEEIQSVKVFLMAKEIKNGVAFVKTIESIMIERPKK